MKNVQKIHDAGRGLVVAVVGSRSMTSCRALTERLGQLEAAGQLAEVVTGGAGGADDVAGRWTRHAAASYAQGLKLTEHRPDYAAHGPAAPLVRNGLVVAGADLVLVVWDGVSTGTLDAARKAARLGKRLEWLAAPAPSAAAVPGGLGL